MKNQPIFSCWIGNQELDFPESFHSTLLSGQELAVSIFAQSIYFLDKSNQWNLKFSPSCLLEENSPNFFVLYWKKGVRFWWNFPQLLTVRTGTCCVNFLLSQIIFLTKANYEIWNFDLFICSKKIQPFFFFFLAELGTRV